MSTAKQEIHGLMADLLDIALADRLPAFCPDTLALSLLEEMEAIWPLISDASKIALASIALSLQHRGGGFVVIAMPRPAPGLH